MNPLEWLVTPQTVTPLEVIWSLGLAMLTFRLCDVLWRVTSRMRTSIGRRIAHLYRRA